MKKKNSFKNVTKIVIQIRNFIENNCKRNTFLLFEIFKKTHLYVPFYLFKLVAVRRICRYSPDRCHKFYSIQLKTNFVRNSLQIYRFHTLGALINENGMATTTDHIDSRKTL